MTRPRLLDLFCGAGGAAMGYHQAGFEVVGVDINPQPRYPFEFHQADALEWPLDGFDVVHASPPCQAYSVLRRANPGASYPDLVEPTRQRLRSLGSPWVMENVPGAPMAAWLILCGSMFDLGANGRQLRRHRLFETSRLLLQLECRHVGEAIGVYGGGRAGRDTFENGVRKGIEGRRGAYQGTANEGREAMGIDWMNRSEITQAIPPAYTAFIGEQLRAHLGIAA